MSDSNLDYLEQLNEAQREAVINTEGPAMIIAGAGSGKTRVLTYRIAHLIRHNGVDPFNILALTFTNKAAREMMDRIEGVVGMDARNLWMGTFHSVFARMLRAEAHKIGYPNNFTIYDTDDSKSLIKTIVKEHQLDDKLYKPNMVYNRISGAKNRLISWEQYLADPIYLEDDQANMRPEIGRLYKEYVLRCFKAGAMDFDDLLFQTNVLFKDHPDTLNKYQQRFEYVLVDEFQDTNLSQYLITKKLSAVRQNICVVGDDAQSIYAFRGADIRNILNFEKDFPELKVYKLEQNYRSTVTIVNAANSIISKNKAQLKKEVWTTNPNGDLIELARATSDNEEGKLVATQIFEDRMTYSLSNKDFAVLYRTNSQSRAIEESLRRQNIPYRIIGGVSFYQRKEIKDLLAYLRFTLNTNDEESFKRIINLPKRGIGQATVDKVLFTANQQSMPLWEVVKGGRKYVGGRAGNALAEFSQLIEVCQMYVQQKDAYDAATAIAKSSGLLKELFDDKTIEGINRYDNVQELLNAIKEFSDNQENENRSLGAFLQEVSLLTSLDENDDNDDRVTLMTIHAAKGLEFPHVYVVGMEEDLFPSQMMLSSRADLEEERRLFYVAVTRAKSRLYLSYALTRYRFGRLKNCEPSRFLDDVDPAFIKMGRQMTFTPPSHQEKSVNQYLNNLKPRKPLKATVTKHQPSADFTPSDPNKLESGMRVEHPKFGFGKVQVIEEDGSYRKARVAFEHFGEKTLLLSFAKLKIVD